MGVIPFKHVPLTLKAIWHWYMGQMGLNYPDRDVWVITPWWHPMRWLLQKPMRYWSYDDYSIGGTYDGIWRYGTYEEAARSILQGFEDKLPDAARGAD